MITPHLCLNIRPNGPAIETLKPLWSGVACKYLLKEVLVGDDIHCCHVTVVGAVCRVQPVEQPLQHGQEGVSVSTRYTGIVQGIQEVRDSFSFSWILFP